jgi:RNA polymerase sigma-B factor
MAIRTATTLHGNLTRISRARADLHQQLRREPSPAEIAAHLHLPAAEVADTLHALAARHSQPLERDLPVPAAHPEDAGFSAAMRQRLSLLDERQRTVIELRFVHGLDDAEIADRLDAAPAAVQGILNTAFENLRSTT